MKIEWLNARLTLEAESPQEMDVLRAIYCAFGKEVDEILGGEDDFDSDAGNAMPPIPAPVATHLGD